jgi:hypothetical protein
VVYPDFDFAKLQIDAATMPTTLTPSRTHEATPQRESVSAVEKWTDTEMRQSEKCQGPSDEPSSSSSDTCETSVRVDDREPGIISRAVSRISLTTNIDPGPAPDGGARAWWSGTSSSAPTCEES